MEWVSVPTHDCLTIETSQKVILIQEFELWDNAKKCFLYELIILKFWKVSYNLCSTKKRKL
jgi:hypothetical protein